MTKPFFISGTRDNLKTPIYPLVGLDGARIPVELASSQERLLPSSISSNVSSTCSEISTTAAFSTDLSQLSSSSSSSSSSDEDTSSHHGEDEDSTCETRTLRDEQATPIMDHESQLYAAASAAPGHRYLGSQTQVGDYELVDNHQHLSKTWTKLFLA